MNVVPNPIDAEPATAPAPVQTGSVEYCGRRAPDFVGYLLTERGEGLTIDVGITRNSVVIATMTGLSPDQVDKYADALKKMAATVRSHRRMAGMPE